MLSTPLKNDMFLFPGKEAKYLSKFYQNCNCNLLFCVFPLQFRLFFIDMWLSCDITAVSMGCWGVFRAGSGMDKGLEMQQRPYKENNGNQKSSYLIGLCLCFVCSV